MIRTYYLLTKPGIILGNLITTAGGFALASRGSLDYLLFLAMLVGLGGVIASACVFNNYIDRDMDKKMARTKNRALAAGTISNRKAIYFALFLGTLGAFVLGKYTNLLTLGVASAGFFIYVGCYSLWKSRTSLATLVGSIAGAIPPVAGYTAVSGSLDMGAVLLFMILVLWQMPHFFAIAMYRLRDYEAAAVPVMPAKRGSHVTKIWMFYYIIAFLIAEFLLLAAGYAGYAYLIVVGVLTFAWLVLCIQGFTVDDDRLWARRMFSFSLVVIMGLCLMIGIDSGPSLNLAK